MGNQQTRDCPSRSSHPTLAGSDSERNDVTSMMSDNSGDPDAKTHHQPIIRTTSSRKISLSSTSSNSVDKIHDVKLLHKKLRQMHDQRFSTDQVQPLQTHSDDKIAEDDDTTRIQKDIEMMFSYLDGWPDDPDDATADIIDRNNLVTPDRSEHLSDLAPDTNVLPLFSKTSITESLSEANEEIVIGKTADKNFESESAVAVSSTRSSIRHQTLTVTDIDPVIVSKPLKLPLSDVGHSLVRDLPLVFEPNYIQLDFSTPSLSLRHDVNKENFHVQVKPTGSHSHMRNSTESQQQVAIYAKIISVPQVLKKSNLNYRSSPIPEDDQDDQDSIDWSSTSGSSTQANCQLALMAKSVAADDLFGHHRGNNDNCQKSYSFDAKIDPNVLREGDIVYSLYQLSCPMPGTLSFASGQIGVLMRKNVGGWCYICMGDREGWAPANYWRPRQKFSAMHFPLLSSVVEEGVMCKDWYFGPISRSDCDFVLMRFGKNGDYLLRDSSVRNGEFTLSMRFRDQTHHFAINRTENNRFTIGNLTFPFDSLADIVFYYKEHTILSDTYAVLKHPFRVQL